MANCEKCVYKDDCDDFGPSIKCYKRGIICDLSKGAFSRIADLKQGIISCRIERIK